MKATKNGIEAEFSETDWRSGQPQRYGWVEKGKEGKTLPKEIIDFVERKPVPVKQPEPVAEIKAEVKPKKITKTKKDDNPKQKDGRTAKRKPGRVGKT